MTQKLYCKWLKKYTELYNIYSGGKENIFTEKEELCLKIIALQIVEGFKNE